MASRNELLRSRVHAAWIFLTPMIFTLALVAGWPLIRTIWFGFTDASLDQLNGYSFVGLDNYVELFSDKIWWRATWNTVMLTVVSVTLETILGMVVALVLNSTFPGRGLLRAAVLIPWAIPTIVSARMWNWMLHDQFGLINDLFMRLGFISSPVAWTANPEIALWTIIVVDVWKTAPFMALLILAGLQMLPSDCYESAKVDGVHPVKVFFKVTLPLVRPALMVAVVFRGLDVLRIFDLIYVLTSNSENTMSMSVYARQQLVDFQNVGLGSTASTALFLIIFAITIAYMWLGKVRFDTQ